MGQDVLYHSAAHTFGLTSIAVSSRGVLKRRQADPFLRKHGMLHLRVRNLLEAIVPGGYGACRVNPLIGCSRSIAQAGKSPG